MSNMSVMKMGVANLLVTLKENRANHKIAYAEAKVGYEKEYCDAVGTAHSKALEACSFKDVTNAVNDILKLSRPQDHTGDYDKVIGMLERCADELVDVTSDEHQRYIMDKWEWSSKFAADTSNYANS